MTFLSLLSTTISSIIYGIIVAAAILALLYVVLKYISKAMVKTKVFYFTGSVLSILLIIQCSLMIGSIQARGEIIAVKIYLSQLVENKYGTINAQESQKIMDSVDEQFPIVGVFVNMANFAGHDISELPEAMSETLDDYLSSYIWHHFLCILGIIIVACLIVMLYDKRNPTPVQPKRRTTMASRKNYDDF